MNLAETLHIGIDPTAGQKPYTFAVLDAECSLVDLGSCELKEIMDLASGLRDIYIAVNGPRNPNTGLVKKEMEGQGLLPGQLRGTNLRKAEYLLRGKGILITSTPSQENQCPEWMRSCFNLYNELDEIGFQPFPTERSSKQYLETHPHAAFCVLLQHQPLSKPTLEGRLQRQLTLYENKVGIKDPMQFFEEITSHRLLQGILPVDTIYAPEQLDALAAAFTAYLAARDPKKISSIGSIEEGLIALPASELLPKY
jgi:hypothetical protein